mgnify:CR=1 FL=1
MTEFWHNFHFLRPYLLLLIVIPVVLYRLYFHNSAILSSWRKVVDEPLLDYLLIKGSSRRRHFYIFSTLAALIFTVLIAAGPSWEQREVPQLQKQNPVFIMLNLSSDMAKEDLKPNRLERAKYKIKDFLGMLTSVQSAMMVYSSEPFVIAPFTQDTGLLQNLLGQVNLDIMPVNGDRLDRAIALAVERIKAAGYDNGSLIIFTPDVGQKFDLALEAAKSAATQNINVNIIGISSANNEKLAMIAQTGSGSYWTIQPDDSRLKTLAQRINDVNAPIKASANQNLQYIDGGWYFLWLPLLGCLMLFRKELLVILLTFILVAPAQAGFFTNADQDGIKAFQNGNFDKAAALFKDKNWQAASYYRLGNYTEAHKLYSLDSSVEGLYNQGNAYAKSGAIKEAIAKYEEVLQIDPNHEDAKFNLDYLKKQQEQQNQQQNQDNQDNQNGQDNQNSQSSSAGDDGDNDNQDEQSSSSSSQENSDNENSEEQNNQSSAQNNDASNNSPADQQSEPQKNDTNKSDQAQQPVPSSSDMKSEDKSSQTPQEREIDENNSSLQGNKTSSVMAQLAEEGEDYDEKLQAKAQQYREIPEDVGGLLRAFIAQEYQKNRYKEN